MVLLANPFQPVLWMIRQSEKDVINLYNLLTPFIQLTTKSNMLNFGYWTDKTKNPLQAQQELCEMVGEFSDLYSARNILDIGSGFSSPATTWKKRYNFLDIVCVNINPQQLSYAAKITIPNYAVKDIKTSSSLLDGNHNTTFTATNINDSNKGSHIITERDSYNTSFYRSLYRQNNIFRVCTTL